MNQTRTKTDSDTLEDQLYQLLINSMHRAEAAARASARIEAELLQDMETTSFKGMHTDPESAFGEQLPGDAEPTTTAAGPEKTSSGEFDQSGFSEVFYSLNAMRTIKELLSILKISDLEDDVMAALVETTFGSGGPKKKVATTPKPAYSPSTPSDTEMVAGGDMGMMLHNIRRTVERKQKLEKRSGRK